MVRALALTLGLALTLAGCGLSGPGFGPGFGAAARPAGLAQAQRLKSRAPAIAAENFRQVDDKLYRLGVPSDADMAELAKLGIKTDITLQSNAANEVNVVKHEKEVAKKLGIEVLHLPLPFGQMPPKAMTDAYLAVFKDPARLPAMVHCHHGRDRTGTMVALYRMVENGWSNARAYTEMQSFGFKEKDYPFFAKFVKTYKPGMEAPEAFSAPVTAGGWDQEALAL